MLLRFFKVESAVIEMIMFFGFPFSFGFFLFNFRFFRDFAGNNLLPMILSASAFNSCMVEFSILDYCETITKNIFKHWTSWSCIPYAMVHRSVLQWTRGERVPLSLYERTFVAVLHFHFMTTCYDCIPQTTEKETVFSFSKQSQAPK